jgi:PAS domain S-box-containing protein
LKESRQIEAKRVFLLIIGTTLITISLSILFTLYPDYNLSGQRWHFYLGLSLPVILLGLFFYLLFLFETRPIKTLTEQFREGLEKDDTGRKIAVKITGTLSNFLDQFNLFLEKNQARCHELEEQKTEIYTSNKVLQYKKKRLEAILEKVPFGILVMDESSTVTFANSKIEDLLGVNKDSMIGHTFQDWSEDEELSAFFTRFQGYQGQLHRVEAMEFTPGHIPDTTVSVAAYPLVLHEDDTSAFGALLICRDVTTEALARRARGEFVAHVSHELKSPLNVLRMYSEMLLGKDGKSKDFRVEAVNVIYDELERLDMLINNLLNISKIEMGSITIERQRIKPLDLLKDTFDSATRSGKKEDIEFKIELPNEMSHIVVDKDLLRIAINNLFTNAVKYNRQGGSVTLTAEENSDQIIIRLRDTGIGIAQDDIEKIFEKFFRSENEEIRKKPGHGLGLTLAKRIIELHHGKLQVESEINKGTEFAIIFEKGGGLVREGL